MNKNWKEITLAVIFIFIILPGMIALSMNIKLICTDTSNEWIGFWGSYIGSIVGAAATVAGVYITIRAENEKIKKEDEIKKQHDTERHRLEIMPHLSRYYHIPKTEGLFYKTETYFVDCRNGFRIYSDLKPDFLKEIKNNTPDNYLLNYRVKNIGLQSAANLYIKIDGNYIIRNGGITSDSFINICILFKTEELNNRKLKIEFKYSDISGLAEYCQFEEFIFKTEQGIAYKDTSLDNISSLSKPERVSE